MTIYYRANGTRFVIDCRDGGPGIFVAKIGAFARALVRRRIGHDSFTLSPA